ncbi:hypothetical protein PV05_09791 [Exophiala xenobiotica]|uniref:Uncharacterized protein n=1 Tax=Exophiala xenobiotica TaxID=348802 RepID=A0A0D2E6J2_9EURO|nr:uncharacterized protein PV05_09791 [Exophiala xenobiotica]KIW51033.1 hypothetical protein PV05_09791 [Exophiala xenobiotica]
MPGRARESVAGAVAERGVERPSSGLRFGLMVGIGGRIPNLPKGLDIRLGDVVISQPNRTFGGVVQYDLKENVGKERFERKGFLKSLPTILLAALSTRGRNMISTTAWFPIYRRTSSRNILI